MAKTDAPVFERQWRALDLRAGVLAYRHNGVEPEILLIRRHGQDGWAIPKGKLMGFRKATESARLEAYQEAGVHGQVGDTPLGSYVHIKSRPGSHHGEPVEVIVFPMAVARVDSQWPESAVRERQWVPASAAADLVGSVKLRNMIQALLAAAPALACA